jgi:uncharacterized membrane protein
MNKRIVISGLVIAMYVALVGAFQSVSFGAIQIRLANSLYALCAIYPFLVIPLGIAVIFSNLIFGGLGIVDIVCGFLVTVMTCYVVSKIKKSWLIILPIILIPGLVVPIWLDYLLKIPYMVLMPIVLVSQIIPAITGTILIKRLKI